MPAELPKFLPFNKRNIVDTPIARAPALRKVPDEALSAIDRHLQVSTFSQDAAAVEQSDHAVKRIAEEYNIPPDAVYGAPLERIARSNVSPIEQLVEKGSGLLQSAEDVRIGQGQVPNLDPRSRRVMDLFQKRAIDRAKRIIEEVQEVDPDKEY